MTLHENVVPPEAEEDFAAWVAIDWADKKHVWALQETGSSRRQPGEIEASPEAVDAWVSELLLRFPGRRIAVALEQKRGALLCLLSKYAALVLYPVHPATVSRMRAALYPSNSKDDPKDADLLLDILLYHRKHLRRLDADTVETRKLQILVEDRCQLVNQATAYGNRLRAKLKLYYPQALRWLPDLHAVVAGEFLKRWPTLPLLQKARRETIEKFFHQHNCRSEELIQKRLEEIPQAVVATTDAAIVDSSVAMVLALVNLMDVLRTHIAALDREIAATAAAHPVLAGSRPGDGAPADRRLGHAAATLCLCQRTVGRHRDRPGQAGQRPERVDSLPLGMSQVLAAELPRVGRTLPCQMHVGPSLLSGANPQGQRTPRSGAGPGLQVAAYPVPLLAGRSTLRRTEVSRGSTAEGFPVRPGGRMKNI